MPETRKGVERLICPDCSGRDPFTVDVVVPEGYTSTLVIEEGDEDTDGFAIYHNDQEEYVTHQVTVRKNPFADVQEALQEGRATVLQGSYEPSVRGWKNT